MASNPTKIQQRGLKDECLTESTLRTWLEIGGKKQEARYVEKHPRSEQKEQGIKIIWESGFGVENEGDWTPIERLKTKIVYEILTKKRNKIKDYIPNKAHKTVHKIQKYLTPEERNYWWRFNHKIISIKKTESKFKRDKEGNLVKPNCPVCNNSEETREHYEYDCPQLTNFRKKLARTIGSTDFTREEWTLKQERVKISTNILIAKARWVFHCERCNVDHNRKKRINQSVILKRTQRRMEVVIATYGDINDTQEAETDTTTRERTLNINP